MFIIIEHSFWLRTPFVECSIIMVYNALALDLLMAPLKFGALTSTMMPSLKRLLKPRKEFPLSSLRFEALA